MNRWHLVSSTHCERHLLMAQQLIWNLNLDCWAISGGNQAMPAISCHALSTFRIAIPWTSMSYPKTLSRKHLSVMENSQSLLSPTYMRISILLSIRLSKCWTLKRSTFLMSYISPQAGATSASEMQINDWEVQIWRFTVAGFTFGDLFQIHLAKASEKSQHSQGRPDMSTNDTKDMWHCHDFVCWQSAKWCLTIAQYPLSFFPSRIQCQVHFRSSSEVCDWALSGQK